jgi:hypothetical protein
VIELRLDISLLTLQVIFLIALQVSSLVVLWLINPLTQAATDTFALYLSLDLLAFVMTSYVYRSRRSSRAPNQAWMACGYLALVVLLVSNLLLA